MDREYIKQAVRENYGSIAARGGGGCGCGTSGCCGTGPGPRDASRAVGYSDEQMGSVPEGANLGLGCGNPTALASLEPGETVLDLGSGAGFDCFLAAGQVGEAGTVIGVDMTPEMVARARENARTAGRPNVEFRLGEIEALPVADASVDVIISNCVINLAPDKDAVFREMLRVLRPGGRAMVSDIALKTPLPDALAADLAAYVGCISGAILLDDYVDRMERAGFRDVEVVAQTGEQTAQWLEEVLTDELLAALGVGRQDALRYGQAIVSVSVKAWK